MNHASYTAESLLTGPRGRRLLLEYARACELVHNPVRSEETFGYAVALASIGVEPGRRYARRYFGPRPPYPKPSEVAPADVAERLDALELPEPTPTVLRTALAATVGSARYWQAADGEDVLAATPKVLRALRHVAHRVAASRLTAWWGTPIVLSAQHSVQWEGAQLTAAPDDVRAVLLSAREREQAARAACRRAARKRLTIGHAATRSGEWWSSPPQVVPSSTRLLSDGRPVGLWFVEDDFGWDSAESVKLTVPADASVFEIADAADWADLCRRFPLEVTAQKCDDWSRATGRTGRWVVPDWVQVAEHYDAVHLQVGAYLSAAGVAIPVDDGDGAASVIAGWNPDQTYWFSPGVVCDGERTRWVLEDDGTDMTWRSAPL